MYKIRKNEHFNENNICPITFYGLKQFLPYTRNEETQINKTRLVPRPLSETAFSQTQFCSNLAKMNISNVAVYKIRVLTHFVPSGIFGLEGISIFCLLEYFGLGRISIF